MITADSNVFVYLSDDRNAVKQSTAQAVVAELARRRSPVALQVIGEVQNVLRRKLKRPPWKAAQEGHNILLAFESFTYVRVTVERALDELATGRLSYWDALLLAAADEAGCTVLLTEDMRDGGRFGGVEIVNPFSSDGTLSPRARDVLGL